MSTTAGEKRRTRERPEVRRQQLVEATIDCIAEHGLSATTMGNVARTAGLSQGIINLHFTSKDNLLAATLEYLQDEYESAWRSAVASAGNDPATQLAALLRTDYQPQIARRKKLAVWFAFWGEAKARPAYRAICRERMNDHHAVLVGILGRMNGMAPGSAEDVAESIAAMADGFWLNLLIGGGDFSRQRARALMMQHLATLFPDHRRAFQA